MLTRSRIDELFEVHPGEGVLRWKRAHRKVKIGDIAGCLHEEGYWRVYADGKSYAAHRLIFFYTWGWLPEQIDHADMDKSNNCISNLRAANNSLNNGNRKLQPNNTSGHRGVHWFKSRSCWRAQLKKDGKNVLTRYFKTKDEAAVVYAQAHAEHFGEFSRLT